jgi:hypothetical protein
MGCLARIGCLLLLAALAVAAWLTRDWWRSRLPWSERQVSTAAISDWQPLTPDGAERARTALQRMQASGGPAYVNVSPADLAAYVFQELSGALPASADSVEARAVDDRLLVRAVVPTSMLGDRNALGPVAALLGERERMQLGGALRIVRPGIGQFRVTELRVRDFPLPPPLIPRLVGQMSRNRPPEVDADALPLRTPDYIADVRVANGMVTMYRRIP